MITKLTLSGFFESEWLKRISIFVASFSNDLNMLALGGSNIIWYTKLFQQTKVCVHLIEEMTCEKCDLCH